MAADDAWLRLFAEAMKEWRERENATQADAARAAGVSDTTWHVLEQGKPASDRTLAKVSRLLYGQPGAWRRLAAGEQPDFVVADQTMIEVDFNSRIARLSPEDQKFVDDMIERLEERRR